MHVMVNPASDYILVTIDLYFDLGSYLYVFSKKMTYNVKTTAVLCDNVSWCIGKSIYLKQGVAACRFVLS